VHHAASRDFGTFPASHAGHILFAGSWGWFRAHRDAGPLPHRVSVEALSHPWIGIAVHSVQSAFIVAAVLGLVLVLG
jgi:hypothetical protein